MNPQERHELKRSLLDINVFAIRVFSTGLAIIFLLCIVWYVYTNEIYDDGMGHWRAKSASSNQCVIFKGKKYYCDHAETMAGFPDRVILYRGDGNFLMLPEKYSVENVQETKQEKEQKKID